MKKTLRMLALVMAVLMCIFAVVACDSNKDANEDTEKKEEVIKPNSDPAKAKENLEKEDYVVTLIDDESVLKLSGIDGLVAAITAMKGTDAEEADAISIYYFKDSDSAKKAEENEFIKEALEEAKKEDNVSTGISGKILWMGTKAAVKAAK